jgi:hypothetical protein
MTGMLQGMMQGVAMGRPVARDAWCVIVRHEAVLEHSSVVPISLIACAST